MMDPRQTPRRAQRLYAAASEYLYWLSGALDDHAAGEVVGDGVWTAARRREDHSLLRLLRATGDPWCLACAFQYAGY